MDSLGRLETTKILIKYLPTVVLSATFIAAGLMKLGAENSIARILDATFPFLAEFSAPVGRFIPPLEVTIGLGLLVKTVRYGAAVLSLVLSIGFGAVMFFVLYEELAISCGCFGSLAAISPKIMIFIDLTMIALSVLLVRSYSSKNISRIGEQPVK